MLEERVGEEMPTGMIFAVLAQKLSTDLRGLADRDFALSPQDLFKEVAVMAERSDTTEELERMRSHLDQFKESLTSRTPVGRKLEFLVQEMLRESNTMASTDWKVIHLNRPAVRGIG